MDVNGLCISMCNLSEKTHFGRIWVVRSSSPDISCGAMFKGVYRGAQGGGEVGEPVGRVDSGEEKPEETGCSGPGPGCSIRSLPCQDNGIPDRRGSPSRSGLYLGGAVRRL